MTDTTSKPVIFLAFANDRDDTIGYLRNLPDEARRLREALEPAEQAGLCEVVVRSNSTAADIFKLFQDPRYRNRVAIFHYGGHANGYELLLESTTGTAATAHADGLAAFLAQQRGLQLVFLNGCSTVQQTFSLLEANISAVISTSRAIDDKVATDFSFQFYQGLAGGAGLQKAFDEAAATIETTCGDDTRALYLDDPTGHTNTFDADQLPWLLSFRPGMDHVASWNLPNAVDDPLFGLPVPPERDLPESPYRHLDWFTGKDSDVFFGRGHQIRELYNRLTAPRTAPIMLFYGQSGVGKSSILDAGLIPRLEHDYDVRYLRRTEAGLLDALRLAFLPQAVDVPLESAWRAKEKQTGKPLIVFLDQVEELYTRPIAGLPDELDQLLEVLKAIFIDPDHRPQGKLVLGFRKEWLAELEAQLIAHELPRTKVFLEPIDRRGIIEIVQGPARSERLRERYGLTVEAGLAEIIADDLLADRDSAIAPTLQILLTKMWTSATAENYEHPQFSQSLYQQLRREGILLRDFLNQQIAAFRERYPDAVDSGLLLDIVSLHTTPLGTADQKTVEQLQEQYAHLDETLPELIQQCQDLHLLTVAASAKQESTRTTRLAHDTLAPLVREQFDVSDKPGQRARRILDNRAVDWVNDKIGTPLDEADLAIVEQGTQGTRVLSPTEQRLLAASRELSARLNRTRLIIKIATVVGVAIITITASIAMWQRSEAERSRDEAVANLKVAREAVQTMLTEVGAEQLRNIPQLEDVRATLLEEALTLYQQLQNRGSNDPQSRFDAALAAHHVGDILRIRAGEGDASDAAVAYQNAIEQLNQLRIEYPEEARYSRQLANSYNWLGELLRPSTEEYAAAREAYESAIALQRDLIKVLDSRRAEQPLPTDPDAPAEVALELARTTYNRGILLSDSGRPGDSDDAVADYQKAIGMLVQLLDANGSSQGVRHELARCRNLLAIELKFQKKLNAALSELDKAIAEFQQLIKQQPTNRQFQFELAQCQNNRANLMLKIAGVAESHSEKDDYFQLALGSNKAANDLFAKLGQPLALYQFELAGTVNSRGSILEDQGAVSDDESQLKLNEQSIEAYAEAVELIEPLIAAHPEYAHRFGIAICNLADRQQTIGRLAEAKQTLDRLSPKLPFDGPRFRKAARIAAACIDADGQLAAGCGEQALDLLELAASRYLAEAITSLESLNDANTEERSELINMIEDRLNVVSELETGSEFALIRTNVDLVTRFDDLTSSFKTLLLKFRERLSAGKSNSK
jgi:tetratricopeptide (TPR) repeat protein